MHYNYVFVKYLFSPHRILSLFIIMRDSVLFIVIFLKGKSSTRQGQFKNIPILIAVMLQVISKQVAVSPGLSVFLFPAKQ